MAQIPPHYQYELGQSPHQQEINLQFLSDNFKYKAGLTFINEELN
jgi:hypothetical protein